MAKEKIENVEKGNVFKSEGFILCALLSVTAIVCTAIKTFGGKGK